MLREPTYTYQGGKRLDLERRRRHFVSRASDADLGARGFTSFRKISAHSWLIESTPDSVRNEIDRARELGPAYPALVIAGTEKDFFVTDRIFVRFRRAMDPVPFTAEHALELVDRYTERDFLFRVGRGCDVIDVVRFLTEERWDDVEQVDHDLNILPQHQDVSRLRPRVVDREPLAREQWYLLSTPINERVHERALVHCERAWEISRGRRDVVIAVIDCGCDMEDPNFGSDKFIGWAVLTKGKLLASRDLRAAKRTTDPAQGSGFHGTLVSTLAAASINHYGGVGAAPGCRLLPVKWSELFGTEHLAQSSFMEVIRFVADKVDVVSCSWNVGPRAYWPPVICDALAATIRNGGPRGTGILWVWSAGNLNCPIHFSSNIDVPTLVVPKGDQMHVVETEREFINSFAEIEGVVHVGAISSFGKRCHYSNYGMGLELVAPSSNLHLYGRQVVDGVEVAAPLRRDGLHSFGGTSAAAPIVAGIAALVRSANMTLTAKEILSVLRSTCGKDLDMEGYPPCSTDDDPQPGWDISPVPPFHKGDFDEQRPDGTWSGWYGYGRVDAATAVGEAVRRRGRTRVSRRTSLQPRS